MILLDPTGLSAWPPPPTEAFESRTRAAFLPSDGRPFNVRKKLCAGTLRRLTCSEPFYNMLYCSISRVDSTHAQPRALAWWTTTGWTARLRAGIRGAGPLQNLPALDAFSAERIT